MGKVKKQVISVTCDLCGKVFEEANTDVFEVQWVGFLESARNTSVQIEDEDGKRTYHICPKCFRKKLEPWLRASGATPTVAN